jgi:hypothetical protein
MLSRAGSDSPNAWILYTLRVLVVRLVSASSRHSEAMPTRTVSLTDI